MTNADRKKRGGLWLRVAVASVAVLGIGGAITTAAWTNQVNYQKSVSAGIHLQGWDGSRWTSGPITFWDTSGVLPNESFTNVVTLRNNSAAPAVVTKASVVNDQLGGEAAFDIALLQGGDEVSQVKIPANGQVELKLRFTANDALAPGSAGKILVTFTGVRA